MKIKESGVLKACLDLLTAERIWHRRWNVGAVKTANRFFRFGQKGDADILASVPMNTATHGFVHIRPQFLWLEIKRPGGRITPEQLAFADDVRAMGHYHMFVDDVSQLQNWLKEHKHN